MSDVELFRSDSGVCLVGGLIMQHGGWGGGGGGKEASVRDGAMQGRDLELCEGSDLITSSF